MQLFSEFKAFKKLKNRMTEKVLKRGILKDSLGGILDMVHADALTSGTPEEAKEFLRSQREDRNISSMAGTDQTSVKKQEWGWLKRKRGNERLLKKPAAVSSMLVKDIALETSSTSSSLTGFDDDDANNLQVTGIVFKCGAVPCVGLVRNFYSH